MVEWAGANKESGAVSRTEDASGAVGVCPQSVESAVLRAFEDASRTREGCFWHRVPQKTPSVQKKGVFVHRMPFSYRKHPPPVRNMLIVGYMPQISSLSRKSLIRS